MGKLRMTFQREVLDVLDTTIYTSDDFVVSFGNTNNSEYLVHIAFKYDKKYSYAIDKSPSGYQVIRKPGELEEEERYKVGDLYVALSGTKDWCKELRNELKASQPIYEEIDSLRATIEEHLNCDKTTNEFTVEEIYNLKSKFEDLLNRVEALEKDKLITEAQLEEFKKGINQVSDDLEYYQKPTWLNTATNKLMKIVMSIGKSKEGRALLTDGAKKLLGFE